MKDRINLPDRVKKIDDFEGLTRMQLHFEILKDASWIMTGDDFWTYCMEPWKGGVYDSYTTEKFLIFQKNPIAYLCSLSGKALYYTLTGLQKWYESRQVRIVNRVKNNLYEVKNER
jgi:hypothetical protein